MPYDHKNATPDGLPLQRMKLLLKEVNHLHCRDRCMIGSGGGSVGLVDLFLEPGADYIISMCFMFISLNIITLKEKTDCAPFSLKNLHRSSCGS